MIGFLKERKNKRSAKSFFASSERYQLLDILGEGSYGVAYLLADLHTNEQVVLKRLKGKHLHSKGLAKFEQEIHFLMQLQQLPVPRVLSEGIIEKTPYYVMSYANGYTFEQAIFAHNKVFTVDETLYYTNKLLQIIQKMHESQIVHRDLRIPNILLKDDELTIIDFGLASKIEHTEMPVHIKDPKKIAHPISDLYATGHFMLFLLYSTFQPATKKGTTWQQELALPADLQHFIERLLTINSPFSSCKEAIETIEIVQKNCTYLKI